jgi:hypothetical protein
MRNYEGQARRLDRLGHRFIWRRAEISNRFFPRTIHTAAFSLPDDLAQDIERPLPDLGLL